MASNPALANEPATHGESELREMDNKSREAQKTKSSTCCCKKEKEPEAAVVRVLDDDDRAVGGEIQVKLEEIFGRITDADPLYESLGKVEGIAKTLNVDLNAGADESTVEQRRKTFGDNKLPEEDPLTFWQILLGAWSDHMIILLTIAAIISLILGLTVPHGKEKEVNYKTGWIEGVAIIIAVLLVTTIGSINDYRKEQKFRKLTEENSKQDISVRRNGQDVVIDVTEIVVGDLVNINPGLVMPCDALFVHGLSVVIDESSVTGENDPKRKNKEHPYLLTGTVVNTAESAWVLACAVGVNSFGGKLLMESRGEGGVRPTPLQERLDNLADNIGKIGITIAVILFVILGIREGVRLGRDEPDADPKRYLEYFIIAVTIIVVAVPEGLPLAVTISLAYSQAKMQSDNNQVRRLKACETMGNATTICSDKTGTLTQNLMSVVQGSISGVNFRVKKPGDHMEKVTVNNMPDDTMKLLTHSIALNSSSVKVVSTKNKEGTTIDAKWMWDVSKGNKTDNALLDFADRLLLTDSDIAKLDSLPHQRIREELLVEGEYTVFPFTSDRKRMSTAVRSQGKTILYVKGGADQIIPLCKCYRTATGEVADLTDAQLETFNAKIKSFAIEANRNIGLAYMELDGSELPSEEPSEGYIWLGVLGIQDPLRPEVIEAVEKCQHAGVVVRMCTGDNIDTAMAISRQCGIFNHGDLAMTGKEFREVVYDSFAVENGREKLSPILARMTVLARSQPLDKQLLVLMHMVRGEIVAVTGDGTNDAPALRLANVGFVMRSGTDIAVKSADIVLLDDNFRSVQRAVVWGRTVNDNIRKFLQLQLTVNVVSVLLTFIGSISSDDSTSPLSTVQLLWVNLIMDTFAALALATEEANVAVLNRGPVDKASPLVSRRMWLFIGTQSIYQLPLTLIMMHLGHTWFHVQKDSLEHTTIVFNIFVWCTIFNMFNARKLYDEKNIFEGFGRSYPFLIIMTIIIVVQVLAVELFRDFMRTRPLTYDQWLGCILAGFICWPICLIQRFIPIKEAVSPKTFNPEEMDEDAQAALKRVEANIERTLEARGEEEKSRTGQALVAAQKKHMRALWHKAAVRHVHQPRVVRAFRRAHEDKDVKDSRGRMMYSQFKEKHA